MAFYRFRSIQYGLYTWLELSAWLWAWSASGERSAAIPPASGNVGACRARALTLEDERRVTYDSLLRILSYNNKINNNNNNNNMLLLLN